MRDEEKGVKQSREKRIGKNQSKERDQKERNRGKEKKREIRLLVGSYFSVYELDC